MGNDELLALPITSLLDLLRKRKVSPVELTQGYLERIQRLDGELNAYITVDHDGAIKSAQKAEVALKNAESPGLLTGIPIAVKDQMDVAGLPTTMGSAFVKETAVSDSTLASRLKNHGAVLLGKLNLSEFAMGGNFVHPYGTPRNPWDTTRQPGHSSSGSGIAVAASLAAATLGEDTGGSVRIPASWCGVTGLRPTWGRLSRHGIRGVSWSMDQAGPMTKTVEDCALVFEAIAGYDSKDPSTSSHAVPSFQAPNDLKNFRVGLVREAMESPALDREVKISIEHALSRMESSGATITEISIPEFTYVGIISAAVTDADAAYVHRHLIREHASEYDQMTRRRIMAGMLMSSELREKALRFRALIRNKILTSLTDVDLLATPTQSTPAPPIPTEPVGFNSVEDVLNGFYGVRGATGPFNLASVPAISIPCGFTAQGLPIGLQLAAGPYEELTLFHAGHIYQQQTDWHKKWPLL